MPQSCKVQVLGENKAFHMDADKRAAQKAEIKKCREENSPINRITNKVKDNIKKKRKTRTNNRAAEYNIKNSSAYKRQQKVLDSVSKANPDAKNLRVTNQNGKVTIYVDGKKQ